MTPKKYNQIIAAITLSLILIGGAGYWFALNVLGDASEKLAAQMGVASSADTRITNLVNTQNAYDKEIAPILTKIDEALPSTPDQTQILEQVQKVAKTTGVSLSGITLSSTATSAATTSTAAKAGGVVPLPLSFQVSGSYAQLQSFLASVENLSRLTTVDSLTVSRSGQTITYAINLSAYSKP
jgi:Tfp pilus assembly protein PilO